jgi:hypothetical protein
MALVKVLGLAVVFGLLFGVGSVAMLDWIEKAVGRGAAVVQLALAGTGALVGAIAGAAQAVVDAIENKPSSRG